MQTTTDDELFEAPHELSPEEAQSVIKQTLTALGGTGRVPAPRNFFETLPAKVQMGLEDVARMFSFNSAIEMLNAKDLNTQEVLQRLHTIRMIDFERVFILYKKSLETADAAG